MGYYRQKFVVRIKRLSKLYYAPTHTQSRDDDTIPELSIPPIPILTV